jgi:predicted permease
MFWPTRLLRRLRLLLWRDRAERVMDEELRHHLECETADLVRQGLSREDARREALRAFGNVEAVKEAGRDARGGRAVEDLARDVRYAARILRRHPFVSIPGMATLALGIGTLTTVCSLVYGVLLRPLPYAQPERLVTLWERDAARDGGPNVVSLDNFEAWRRRATSFERMAALVPTSLTFTTDTAPERIPGAEVSPELLDLLGVRPAIGRTFVPEDARSGRVVMLSDGLWRRRFGADPQVAGRGVTLSGSAYTVVGVMPPGFEPPAFGWLGRQDFWVPFVAAPESRSWGRFLLVVAKLRRDRSLDQARVELSAIAASLAVLPDNRGWSSVVRTLSDTITGSVRTPLIVLLAAAGLLMLIAVTNLATLMLSMTRSRAQELAVRRALGATDGRLFRQLFVQGAVLGTAGAALGFALAVPAVRVLVALLPEDVPRAGSVALDVPVFLISSCVAVAATLAFGTIAAFRGRPTRTVPLIVRDAGDTRTSARSGGSALVVIEISLALSLGVMSLLMVRSFMSLRQVDLGFRPEGVMVGRVALPPTYVEAGAQKAFFDALAERAASLPGVDAAGIISMRPLGGLGPATTVRAAGEPAPAGHDPVVDFRSADAEAFKALGLVFEDGSGFDRRDAAGAPPRAVISASLARILWPGRRAVGRTLTMKAYGELTVEVAGVVEDVQLRAPRLPPRPSVYLSAAQFPDSVRDIVVRTGGSPEAIVPELRTLLASMDGSVPLYETATLTSLVSQSLGRDRLTTILLGLFAAGALMLAAIGVFGVCTGDVTQRRREIGLRLALGASETRIACELLLRMLARYMLGIGAGIGLGLALGRGMSSLLFGVTPFDPLSFVAIGALVLALAIVATLVPAIRALRAAPLAALRES